MSQKQYWVVCINEGLMGFAYADCYRHAGEIALSMLLILDVPPQPIWLFPIGPRLFNTETIETGEC
jgi:hypothetical protein